VLFYSIDHIVLMTLAAIVIDWWIGDPRWLTHPVIWIGRWIALLRKLLLGGKTISPTNQRMRGILLTVSTVCLAGGAAWALVAAANAIHTWLGYVVQTWLISTTIAVKGLKDAALPIAAALERGEMAEARKQVGYIVGRDTDQLDESEVSRATVETVAENSVDAFVSPIVFALLGGAPLAMLYRAANTLDSMVGYKNEKYMYFGWASARFDDLMNYIPARLTGIMVILYGFMIPGLSGRRSASAIARFSRLHPSPNSGIPEAGVAGALGIELGGTNSYGGIVGERARMGWPLRPLEAVDIRRTVRILYGVSYFAAGGLLCAAVLAGWFHR
jgi:adenosylcobinamide-phosphate synthase